MNNLEEVDALYEEEMEISGALIFYPLAMAATLVLAVICAIASANIVTMTIFLAASVFYIHPKFEEQTEWGKARLVVIRARRHELVSAAIYSAQQES